MLKTKQEDSSVGRGNSEVISAQDVKKRSAAQSIAEILYNLDTPATGDSQELIQALQSIAGEVRSLNRNVSRILAALENSRSRTSYLEGRMNNVMADALLNAALFLERQGTDIKPEQPAEFRKECKESTGKIICRDKGTQFILDNYAKWAQPHVLDIFGRMYQKEQELGIKINSVTLMRKHVPRTEHRIYSRNKRIWDNFKDFTDSYNIWLQVKKEEYDEIIVDV